MTNKARRVNVVDGDYVGEVIQDDPSGTHHLAPVDEYEVVKKEVWERVKQSLMAITQLEYKTTGIAAVNIAASALAEIGTMPCEPCDDEEWHRRLDDIGGSNE